MSFIIMAAGPRSFNDCLACGLWSLWHDDMFVLLASTLQVSFLFWPRRDGMLMLKVGKPISQSLLPRTNAGAWG